MLTPEKARSILGHTGGHRYRFSPDKFWGYFDEGHKLLAKGWCQGAYARSRKGYRLESGKSKHAASWCAMGALEKVTPEWKETKVARALLAAALDAGDRWSVASVNDHHDKAQAKHQVMEGYRAVISVLKILCEA